MEVRGEMIVLKEWDSEEDDSDEDEDEDEEGAEEGAKEGAKETGRNDGPLDIASDGKDDRREEDGTVLDEGRKGMVRAWSVPSSAGDPADTTITELDMLMEGY